MQQRVTIDGADTHFVCEPGESVLRGALRAGVGFPYECNSGGCGCCAFELLSGEIEDRWPQAPGLAERARQRGRRLGCQSIPRSECRIKVRVSPEAVPQIRPQRFDVALHSVRALTHDMAEFTFHSDRPAQFLPGQYASLSLPGVSGARAYSMSNLANDAGEWRFIVKRMVGGQASEVLFNGLAVGDRIGLDGPYGLSYLRSDSPRELVCVAGGSGLSPVLSVLRGAAADARFEGRRMTLFYGGRGPADLCASAEIDADPTLRGRVDVRCAISDPQAPAAAQWQGARGFVHELLRDTLGEACGNCEFYFCGPPKMTDAVHRLLLLERKVPAAQLHFDCFL